MMKEFLVVDVFKFIFIILLVVHALSIFSPLVMT